MPLRQQIVDEFKVKNYFCINLDLLISMSLSSCSTFYLFTKPIFSYPCIIPSPFLYVFIYSLVINSLLYLFFIFPTEYSLFLLAFSYWCTAPLSFQNDRSPGVCFHACLPRYLAVLATCASSSFLPVRTVPWYAYHSLVTVFPFGSIPVSTPVPLIHSTNVIYCGISNTPL